MSVNGDEAESSTVMFNDSVQKLPSIIQSLKHLSAGERSSLVSLVMYSSFSLPLSYSLVIILLKVEFVKIESYFSSIYQVDFSVSCIITLHALFQLYLCFSATPIVLSLYLQ